MIDDLRAITLFVHTVDLGSFRACAEHFKLSPSVVSHQISQLEKKHGVALLYRSTRKLALTHEGQVFYDQASQMVAAASNALDTLSGESSSPVGKLTLSFPASLIHSALMKKITDFAKAYPSISLDLRFSDHRVDLISEGIDLAFRVGDMKDSSLKSKRISLIKRKLVCTPDYLSKQENPTHPKDLESWDWIKMQMMPPYRTLVDPKNKPFDVHFTPHIEVDSADAMYKLTCDGLGLSSPPTFMLEDDLKQNRLVEILPEWTVADMQIYAVWPNNVKRGSITQLLIKSLAE